MGRTPLRSIKDHEPLFGTGDRGVQPAGAVPSGATKTVIEHDHALPLRALGLVAGDGVAPHRLDQAPLEPVVTPLALGIVLDVVVEVPEVDPIVGTTEGPA